MTNFEPIYPADIPFERAFVFRQSPDGSTYGVWVPIGMPVLGRYNGILDTVCFLYADAESARDGRDFGGTGFLIGLPFSDGRQTHRHTYIASNWHVAVKDGFSVARINKNDGTAVPLAAGPEDWIFSPRSHDIAVLPVLLPNNEGLRVVYLEDGFLMTEAEYASLEIGPGDDVFMAGRFIDYDGGATNEPALRFGNISMNSAAILQPTGFRGGSVIVDMHSRTGFSGSPVFVYRTIGSHFLDPIPPGALIEGGGHVMKLLGVHWGQFPELWELETKKAEQRKKGETADASLITEGQYVKGLSGMTCVCPSWALRDLLDTPKLVEQRNWLEAEATRQLGPPKDAIAE